MPEWINPRTTDAFNKRRILLQVLWNQTCIDGFLWDLNSSDEVNGEVCLTSGGYDPCPFCNTENYIDYALDEDNGVTKENILNYIEQLKAKYS